ncbi:MAG: VCBS repeat-containing protein [Ignavibacteriae bacterium]|nr:MAG: VCBS repeat-containing protein [Ignavibacteriota bacterium]
MKNFTIVLIVFLILLIPEIKTFSSDNPSTLNKVFSKDDIKKLADVYINNNLGLKNPAIVDVDEDGDFDILIFNDGNVEYYKNTGTLEKPFFIPENMKYDKYTATLFLDIALPYPVFFADKNGDNSPDMFVIKDKIYDAKQQKYEYKVLYAENGLNLDTGVLITIVLVLLIIVLVIIII